MVKVDRREVLVCPKKRVRFIGYVTYHTRTKEWGSRLFVCLFVSYTKAYSNNYFIYVYTDVRTHVMVCMCFYYKISYFSSTYYTKL